MNKFLIIPLFFGLIFTKSAIFGIAEAGESLESKLRLTFEERIRWTDRHELDLDTDTGKNLDYMEILTRVGVVFTPDENTTFSARMANDNRPYFQPKTRYEIDEVIFDKFYLKLDKVLGTPHSLTIGRQEIKYGEGFIIFDGIAKAGLLTNYFDAVKGSLNFSKTTVDIFITRQPKEDEFLVINSLHKPLNRNLGTMQAAGIYLVNKSLDKHQLDTYYLYSHEMTNSPKVELNTIGFRASGPLAEKIDYAFEIARQIGETDNNPKAALGGLAHLTYKLPIKYSPAIKLEYDYFSGDDPDTAKDEGWDPVYSTYNKYDNLYPYLLALDYGSISYWTNLQQLRLIGTLSLTKKQSLELSYAYLLANQHIRGARYGSGYTRGSLFGIDYKIKLTPNIDARAFTEYFIPGNFYSDGADPASMFRFEIGYKF
ncbi:MAG: alginate export family protein [Candidatus Omnitrophica bacterium]|nr:alginate export family protein [Candidatus Omnitrophota bacterium]MBU1922889.1 alginate export family protein [Candidatus Omnitrophota bacterium]